MLFTVVVSTGSMCGGGVEGVAGGGGRLYTRIGFLKL